jgi:hypothetical protein
MKDSIHFYSKKWLTLKTPWQAVESL